MTLPRTFVAAAALWLGVSALVLFTPAALGEVCDGRAAGLGLGIRPPAPPQAYDLPVGATWVDTTEDLAQLLAWSAAQNPVPLDIVLVDGIYEPIGLPKGFLEIHGSHRLWSQTPGGAVLRFGIHIGSNGNPHLAAGAELHGLTLEVGEEEFGARANPDHTSSAILTWGTARNVVIEDVTLRGFDGALPGLDRGIDARQADGLVVRRVDIAGFKRFGVFTDAIDTEPWRTDAILEDVTIETVGDNLWAWSLPPEHPDYDPAYPFYDPLDPFVPAQEVGLWLGVPGRVSRARVRDVARSAIQTADGATGSLLEDLDVDQVNWRPTGVHSINGTGLYLENATVTTTFRRFCVGPDVVKGVVSEWDHFVHPRGVRNRVEDGLVEASWLGIVLDHGTFDSRVENITFRNASWAGLTLYENRWPTDDRTTIEVLYRDLVDDGLPLGACLVTAHHPLNTVACDEPPPSPQSP